MILSGHQLHGQEETVCPCCEVGTRTRDIKWVSGKEGVNILSNAKVSQGGGELSQLPGLRNASALLSFLWVQYKDTQNTDCLWHRRTASLLTSTFTLHHYSSGTKIKTDNTPGFFFSSQKAKESFRTWTFQVVKNSQAESGSHICQSMSGCNT